MSSRIIGLLVLVSVGACRSEPSPSAANALGPNVADERAVRQALPAPRIGGAGSLERVLHERRSGRRFTTRALSTEDIAMLSWAAQGVTYPAHGLRTAPSAGGLYPLELSLVSPEGVARYDAEAHALGMMTTGDRRTCLKAAALDQSAVGEAWGTFVLSAVVERTRSKYGSRAERYVALEAGHAAQNLLLEATARRLAAVPIGAFDDTAAARCLGLPDEESVLYLIPVGHPQTP